MFYCNTNNIGLNPSRPLSMATPVDVGQIHRPCNYPNTSPLLNIQTAHH